MDRHTTTPDTFVRKAKGGLLDQMWQDWQEYRRAMGVEDTPVAFQQWMEEGSPSAAQATDDVFGGL